MHSQAKQKQTNRFRVSRIPHRTFFFRRKRHFSTIEMNTIKILKRCSSQLSYLTYRSFNMTRVLSRASGANWPFFKRYGLFAALGFLWTAKSVTDEKRDEKKKQLLQNADSLFENGHYSQCHTLLLSYEDESDVEIIWRIVRALYNMSKDPNAPNEDKKQLIMKAYKMIHDSLKKHGDHYAVHKWYALLLDAKSGYEGTKERINQLENVKKHLDTAVTLNPSDATTLYMLGEWCYQIADMPWYQRQIAKAVFASPPVSTYEEALKYFLKAEETEPRFYSLNLLMIGKTYLKLNKPDQAKYYLGLAASYPAKSNDDHQANKEAAELLKKLK